MPSRPRHFGDLAILLLGVLLVRALPRLILLEHSFVTIHDNLDSDFVYRVLITQPGRLFDGDGIIPEMMGGQPRWTFPAGPKLSSLIFWLFRPFWAYVVLEGLVSASAVAGMWLLLTDYLASPRLQAAGIAFLFALLPYYPVYELSVAGQPALAWAVLGLWFGRDRWWALAVCVAFPFASILQMSGAFVAFEVAASLLLGIALVRKNLTWQRLVWPLAGLAAVGFGYLLTEASFLYHFLLTDFVSQRSEFAGESNLEISHALLWKGSYHAASKHTPILLLALAATLYAAALRRWSVARWLSLGILGCAALAYSASPFAVPGFASLAERHAALHQITFRFWWSLPLAWFALLGFLGSRWSSLRLPSWLFAVFLACEGYWIVTDPGELATNYGLLVRRVTHEEPPPGARPVWTYRDFKSTVALKAIKRHVGTQPGRFVAFGFHPSVLHLAGMATADGYRDNYPLEYKLRFRPLIADTLARFRDQRHAFDAGGRRVYVPVPRISISRYSKNPKAQSGILRAAWAFDAPTARSLGIGWLVSTYELRGNGKPASLRYEGTFVNPGGGHTFYLYRVR